MMEEVDEYLREQDLFFMMGFLDNENPATYCSHKFGLGKEKHPRDVEFLFVLGL